MVEINVNNEFFEDEEAFDKLEKKDFDSNSVLNLKLDVEEISKESEITQLISYDSIKDNLEYELPHQRNGAIKILRDFNCSALLADEVGLGKTITTGMIIKECIARGFVKKALILTPPSLVDQWVSELKNKFEIDFHIIEKQEDWNNNLVIASIDRVKGWDSKLGRFKHQKAHDTSWDLLIVDEAHKLKDKNTARWSFVDKIPKKRFLILTATPFQNDLIELYSLLNLLKRGHLGTIKEFKKNFLFKGNKRHPLNPAELKRKLEEVMIRRRRDETNIQYMKRIPKIVAVELTKEEMEVYEAIYDLLQTKYFSSRGNEINGSLIIYALLPKITSSSRSAVESLTNIVNNMKYHETTRDYAQRIIDRYKELKTDSKIETLIKLVEDIFREDKNAKLLIYTKHPTTASYIAEKLQYLNLKTIQFVGGLNREEKTEIVRQFKEEARIMISTETGTEGLNFQFCNNLINYDLPWNPMSVEQRIGRLDRIGQKRDMMIYSFATKGTMEEKVVDLIINKMCCIGLVIGELPIILFNLGLDGKSEEGVHKIEEMLMETFLKSKNNLEKFSKGVDKIAKMLEEGIANYQQTKENNTKLLDEKNKSEEIKQV